MGGRQAGRDDKPIGGGACQSPAPLRGKRRRRAGVLSHEFDHFLPPAGEAKLARQAGLPQRPADAGHSRQDAAPVFRRPKHEEDEINRLAVTRIKVDGPGEAPEKHHRTKCSGQLRMWQSDALAKPSGSEFLPILQRAKDLLRRAAEPRRHLCRHSLKKSLLVARTHGERHVCFSQMCHNVITAPARDDRSARMRHGLDIGRHLQIKSDNLSRVKLHEHVSVHNPAQGLR